ncbi:Uncharacterised protein [Salmonella enterica subsp. enterica serovar Bovismorbificans]|uniref:Uncharacterized protein n=1 Tax=Salmonella enterica subsp. enterica serovar Bovismorbificans TaxID=58097 RepID=A0A655BX64_SALET|nr:Uncharacterised protein [Salmonella enterica subsp. enterica serovar Bovismorbificans]
MLALFWRLLVPRHFVKLRRLLTHIRLHLFQELTLLAGELIRIHDFAAGGRFRWRTHARLATFQLFDVTPALFRFWRKPIAGDFLVL